MGSAANRQLPPFAPPLRFRKGWGTRLARQQRFSFARFSRVLLRSSSCCIFTRNRHSKVRSLASLVRKTRALACSLWASIRLMESNDADFSCGFGVDLERHLASER